MLILLLATFIIPVALVAYTNTNPDRGFLFTATGLIISGYILSLNIMFPGLFSSAPTPLTGDEKFVLWLWAAVIPAVSIILYLKYHFPDLERSDNEKRTAV